MAESSAKSDSLPSAAVVPVVVEEEEEEEEAVGVGAMVEGMGGTVMHGTPDDLSKSILLIFICGSARSNCAYINSSTGRKQRNRLV